MKYLKSLFASCLLQVIASGTPVFAAVRLPAIISTHMVIQANATPRLWGWAKPSEKIEIRYLGKTLHTVADASGDWQVSLGKIKPGTKFDLEIQGENLLTVRDVLAGEVWVCAGQSNMEFPLARANNGEAELEAHSWPQIRFFKVKEVPSASAMNDVEGQWTVFSPQNARSWSAVGYFFAKDVSEHLREPVGMIQSLRGGTTAQVWMSRDALGKDATVSAIWASPETNHSPFDSPSCLYNGMISGITNYTISGITWYQGESNVRQAQLYRKLFQGLIEDWRNSWKNSRLPFLFVQLPNYGGEKAPDANWADLREAQADALKLPDTAMVVTIDVGDSKDKHPTNKKPVGHRLALKALSQVYRQNVVDSGPVFQSMKVSTNTVICQFRNGDGILRSRNGSPVSGFEISGADHKFVPAVARIDGKKLVLSSPQIPQPVFVRYAWSNDPDANLENGQGLPAQPFRTDGQSP